jgi:hypothetical protein
VSTPEKENAGRQPGAHEVNTDQTISTECGSVKLSAFRRCTDTAPVKDLTLDEVAALVLSDKLQPSTQKVRAALAAAGGDKKAATVSAAKKALPCVTVSGTGPGHKEADLQTHSGLVQLDFDQPDNVSESEWRQKACEILTQVLPASPHVALAFVSPTATGVKAFLRVEVPPGMTAEQLRVWHRQAAIPAAFDYAEKLTGQALDRSCVDPMRLCFLCEDSQAYYHPQAVPLPVPVCTLPVQASPADSATTDAPKPKSRTAEAMQRSVQREDFAKWAEANGFTGDLRELDMVALLDAAGLNPAPRGNGKHAVRCPWESAHTTGEGTTTTVVFESNEERGFRHGFNCQHAHCADRTVRDLLAFVQQASPGLVDQHCRKAYSRVTVVDETTDEDSVEAPAFPVEALNPAARDIVADISEIEDIDAGLPGAAALAVLAAAIGKGARCVGGVRNLSKQTPANIMLAVAAPPSFGKNGITTILHPLTEADTALAEDFNLRERGALEAEQEELEAAVSRIRQEMKAAKWSSQPEPKKEPARSALTAAKTRLAEVSALLKRAPQLIVGSATGPALAEAMTRNAETLFSFGFEAADIIRVALGKYTGDGKADFDLILSSYTGEAHRESRVQRGALALKAPCMTALWVCQPSVLEETITSREAEERGMLARLMYSAHLRETIPHENADFREPSARAAAAWNAAVRAVLDRYRQREAPVVFPVTADARQVLHDFHNRTVDLRNGTLRDDEALLGRLRENALRLALGQAVLDVVAGDADEVLTADHAQRGIALAEYGHYSVIAFRSPARHRRRQERLRALVDVLRDRGGEATLRVLRDHHSFSAQEVERLAALFATKLRVEKRTSSATTGGRPSQVCVLIPPGSNGNPQK